MTKVIPPELREWDVYQLVDPRSDEPFYVGLTCQKHARLLGHISHARYRSSAKAKRIRDIMGSGHQPILRVLATFSQKEAAARYESEQIAALQAATNYRGAVHPGGANGLLSFGT